MADLIRQPPNRDAVLDTEGRDPNVIGQRWLRWLTDLRDAVNKLIEGVFGGNVTVAGTLKVTGAFSAASAAIAGAITAASATLVGALSAGSAAITGAITAASAAIAGAITAATLTLSGLLTLNGGQIQFPATQVPSADANTLDDYEEGLITPLTPIVIAFAGSALNYQKMGSWVHCTGFVAFPVTADGNGAGFTNLPYTCENSAQARGGCIPHFDTSGLGGSLVVLNNSTAVQILNPVTGVQYTNAQYTGATVIFDFKYRAAA